MKFKVENLGKIKRAEFELGELTVICGENNSGKELSNQFIIWFSIRVVAVSSDLQKTSPVGGNF